MNVSEIESTKDLESASWSKKQWVDDQMQYKLYNINQPPEGTPPSEPLACVAQKTPRNMGKIFQIYLNFGDHRPVISDPFYMHEAGHIIFGHLNKNLNEDPEIIRGIVAAYKKVKDTFPVAEQNQFLQYFKTTVYNIIQDFEVNSKLFTEEEFDVMETIGSAMMGQDIKFCWPTRYDYPTGKDWMYYLNAILRDPEHFLEKMAENMGDDGNEQQQSGSGGGRSRQQQGSLFKNDDENQSGSGEGSGDGEESDEEGEETGSGSGKGEKSDEQSDKSSGKGDSDEGDNADDVGDSDDEASGEADDGDDEADDGIGSREASHEFKNEGAGHSSVNTGAAKLGAKEFAQRVMQALKKYADQQSTETRNKVAEEIDNAVLSEMGGTEIEVLPQETMRDILTLIMRKLKKADVAKSRRDIMYNYNRGKLGTGKQTIIPRPINDRQERKSSMICMIDVSGSVSSEFVQEVINNFAFVGKKLGKDTRIITCGDEVLSDVNILEAATKGVQVGGGTDLKVGFRYINDKKYLKSKDDIFFLISDLEDWDAQGFNHELAALKATKYCLFIDGYYKKWETETDLGLWDEYYKYDPNNDGF